MPNNTSIELAVSGDSKVLQLFIASHIVKLDVPDKYSDETHHFDFNTIIPQPALYARNAFSVTDKGVGMYGGIWEYKDEELPAKLSEKYGHSDWYGWCVANWGVKWNSYDNLLNTDTHDYNGSGSILLCFQTAWTIPEGIFVELSELYPELTFEVECLEEGGGFAGTIVYEEGFADETNLHTDIETWREVATNMCGYEFDEDGNLI